MRFSSSKSYDIILGMQIKIGVFDSGSGGLTALTDLRSLLPEAEIYYIGDSAHHPYGEKPSTELIDVTTGVVQRLVDWGASIVLIACNTATTRCIHALRQRFPRVSFVGMEPALKPACDAGCQKIALLATPSTIKSEQVKRLVRNNIGQQDLILLPCAGLADMIESGMPKQSEYILKPYQAWQMPTISSQSVTKIQHKLQELVAKIPQREQIDAVVLGCTHYILIKPEIQQLFLNARFFDGNLGTVKQLQRKITECKR